VGLIYTNITRDGTLRGPDISQTNRIAEVSGLPVILSGGISSTEDVDAVYREKHPKVTGVLIGKALYEKRVDLKQLVDAYQKK
jgi:phosphoribosylformimino-5-aminoimidazole carboxamide ribotide isomerase